MLDNVIITVSGKKGPLLWSHRNHFRLNLLESDAGCYVAVARRLAAPQQNSQIRLKIHCQAWAEFFSRLGLRPKPLSEECVKSAKYCNYAHNCYFHQYALAQNFETEHFMA